SFGEIGRLIDISGLQSDIKKNFPLFLKVTPGAEISIKISYDAARFDDAAIVRLMGHLSVLIDGIASNPDRCLIDLPLLLHDERRQLIEVWNETARDYPSDRTIPRLFETCAERTPDRIAVVCEDHSLSFDYLNQRANQLGRWLQTMGVGPEELVILCVERGVN